MRSTARVLLGAFVLHAAWAHAQASPAASAAKPASPDGIERELAPYGQFRTHRMLSWHPLGREMLVRTRAGAVDQVHLVSDPGVPPQPLTDLPDGVKDASFEPTAGRYFVFTRAEGGHGVPRLYRYDLEPRTATALSLEGERVGAMAWARTGDRIAYAARAVEADHSRKPARTEIHLMDPLQPQSDRVLARVAGDWRDLAFSEDGKRLVLAESVSARESRLWVMDVSTGKLRRATWAGRNVSYGEARFSGDGRGLFATSDRGSEFRRLVYIALPGGRERVLTGRIPRDVDAFAISFEAGRIAFVTNEDGSHVLRFLNLATLKEVPRPSLVHGVIGELAWRPGTDEVAFDVTSARSAGDVFSYDVKTNRVTRWTNGNSPAVNTGAFVEPVIVRWKSFDGREISGFFYRPPARFTGKRPVVVSLHDGPGGQARAGFIGRGNYLVNELGVALLYPNVRGSSGFGKRFLGLADGGKSGNAVKDIGALLDWIHGQPDLDSGRVAITGSGLGGTLALACVARYPGRFAALPGTAALLAP
jgi:dipeptidyl aminopeptidase/acylaminoacyl peptidase